MTARPHAFRPFVTECLTSAVPVSAPGLPLYNMPVSNPTLPAILLAFVGLQHHLQALISASCGSTKSHHVAALKLMKVTP
jgi:hypothetical protein